MWGNEDSRVSSAHARIARIDHTNDNESETARKSKRRIAVPRKRCQRKIACTGFVLARSTFEKTRIMDGKWHAVPFNQRGKYTI